METILARDQGSIFFYLFILQLVREALVFIAWANETS